MYCTQQNVTYIEVHTKAYTLELGLLFGSIVLKAKALSYHGRLCYGDSFTSIDQSNILSTVFKDCAIVYYLILSVLADELFKLLNASTSLRNYHCEGEQSTKVPAPESPLYISG